MHTTIELWNFALENYTGNEQNMILHQINFELNFSEDEKTPIDFSQMKIVWSVARASVFLFESIRPQRNRNEYHAIVRI